MPTVNKIIQLDLKKINNFANFGKKEDLSKISKLV